MLRAVRRKASYYRSTTRNGCGLPRSGDRKHALSPARITLNSTATSRTLPVVSPPCLLGAKWDGGRRWFAVFPPLSHFREEQDVNDTTYWGHRIVEHYRNKDYDAAIKAWNEMKQAHVQPTLFICICILAVYRQTNQLDEAYELAKYILDQNVRITDSAGNQMIDIFARVGDVDNLLKTTHLMLQKQIQIRMWCMRSVYKLYLSTFDPRILNFVADMIRNRQMAPTDKTATSMFNACLQEAAVVNDANTFQQTLALMESLHVPIEPSQRAQLIGIYGRLGDMQKMEEVAEQLTNEGISLASICRHLLSSYAEMGDLFKTQQLVERMRRENIPIDPRVVVTLLYLYINVGFYKEATQLFEEEQRKGKLNRGIYSPMMRLYALTGNVKAAQELLDYMRANSIHVSTTAYTSLLELFAAVGDVASARRIEQQIRKIYGAQALNIYMYSTLLRLYSEQQELDEVNRLFDDMLVNISVPPATAFSSVLSAYLATNNEAKALEFFEQYKTTYPYAAALMYRTLIGWAKKQGDTKRAEKYESELQTLLQEREKASV